MNSDRANPNAHLTSGRRLARNTVWNLMGNAVPLAVAFCCIPLLIKGLGTDRFGVVTLAWALIGYATLFDLGLGRALTQLISQRLGTGEEQEVPLLLWTSLLLLLALGLIATIGIVMLAPWLVHRLHVPAALSHETLYSVYLLAISLPAVISTAGLRGVLEAYQRFDLIFALRIPMGIFAYAAPLAVLPFSKSLVPVMAVLVLGRLLAWAAHLICCIIAIPVLRTRLAFHRRVVGPLLRFGGWMTITNIVGPLMVTMDRFVIGSLLSVSEVAFYATPYEVVTKLWLIPGSLLGVMFPAFSTSFVQDRHRAALLYGRSVKYLLLVLFPVVLLIVVFARDGLRLWLGAEFAQHSTVVLQWLAVGVFINCLAQAPFAVVQGAGRPDLTAKLHLVELPIYLLALAFLTKFRGIEGVAMAWTIRVAIDALVLFWLAGRFLPVQSSIKMLTPSLIVAALAIFALGTVPGVFMTKILLLLVVLLPSALFAWFILLSPEERKLVQAPVRL